MSVIVPRTEHNSKSVKPYKAGLWLAAFAVIAIFILFLRHTKPAFLCDTDQAGRFSSQWRIAETDLVANILWQKSGLSNLRTTGESDGKLAISENLVLFARGPSNEICQRGDDLVALRISDGSLRWSFPADLLHWIQRAGDDFIIVFGDTSAALLEEDGTRRWLYDDFPARSVRSAYRSGSAFYLPSYTSTYILTLEGRRLATLEDQVILGGFDPFVIVSDTTQSIDLIDFENRAEIQSIHLPYPVQYMDFGYSGDFLMISVGGQIEIYDVKTGNLLWSMTENFFSIPVIIQDKVAVYTPNHYLKFFDITTGEQTAEIVLDRDEDHQWNDWESHVLLAAYGDTIGILYPVNGELITLRVNFD